MKKSVANYKKLDAWGVFANGLKYYKKLFGKGDTDLVDILRNSDVPREYRLWLFYRMAEIETLVLFAVDCAVAAAAYADAVVNTEATEAGKAATYSASDCAATAADIAASFAAKGVDRYVSYYAEAAAEAAVRAMVTSYVFYEHVPRWLNEQIEAAIWLLENEE